MSFLFPLYFYFLISSRSASVCRNHYDWCDHDKCKMSALSTFGYLELSLVLHLFSMKMQLMYCKISLDNRVRQYALSTEDSVKCTSYDKFSSIRRHGKMLRQNI